MQVPPLLSADPFSKTIFSHNPQNTNTSLTRVLSGAQQPLYQSYLNQQIRFLQPDLLVFWGQLNLLRQHWDRSIQEFCKSLGAENLEACL